MLRNASGWVVNDKRVERIWRQEGLKVPPRQPKRSRIWPGDGACIRLRAERPNHVWSYDFVEDRTHDGRKYPMLNVVDEFTRECLSIRINQTLKSSDVIDVLSDLFILRGVPEHIRPDNVPEFAAKAVQDWIAAVGAKTAYIEPESPWENGYIESFNACIRDELLNGEIFYTLAEARVIVESWRRFYNSLRPHGSLGYRPRRYSFRSPRGRLRYPGRLRRPRWRRGHPCTNIQPAPRVGGRSLGEAFSNSIRFRLDLLSLGFPFKLHGCPALGLSGALGQPGSCPHHCFRAIIGRTCLEFFQEADLGRFSFLSAV
jgi:putative transposase